MRITRIPWLAMVSYLLIAIPTSGTAQRLEPPTWVEPEARLLASSVAVEASTEFLLELTLDGAEAARLITAMERIRTDTSLAPAQRDAILHGYVERLRDYSPGTTPKAVLDWLSQASALAVTGHEEGGHHGVALFNVAGAAHGLANQWAWQRGHDEVIGTTPTHPPTLAEELDQLSPESPRYRGMRFAIGRLPTDRLETLAANCAVMPGGCGEARADIELARGNLAWLKAWLTDASSAALIPRLRTARRFMPSTQASDLIRAALEHPDKGVAAWAMSDLTAHMPKEDSLRRKWGSHLLSLLDDPELGAAAALQLARMNPADWLEAAAAQPLGEDARRRLGLMVEVENALQKSDAEHEAVP